MQSLINKLKEEEQDFEFYPTTNEIIAEVVNHIKTLDYHATYSILDIGAGNGKVLKGISESFSENGNVTVYPLYAIEKSKILCEQLPKEVFIIGTDFDQQTLIDKEVNIIFCNPPYKQYESWAEKIIRQSNSNYLYLVIPERWQHSKNIQAAIKARHLKYEVVGSFSFENSEDRKARANVNLICLYYHKGYKRVDSDPFDVWFQDNFKFDIEERKASDYEEERSKKEKLDSLIKKENLIYELETFYNSDMQELLENYRAVEKLSYQILKELNIDIASLKEALKMKIKGLKNIYWEKLFDNLNTITDRLTSDTRKKCLDKMMKYTSVDFTANNAYAVVMWLIKNANSYFDSQLLSLYKRLSGSENIIPYKSNIHFVKDNWRYEKENANNYKLDYRLVIECYHAVKKESAFYYSCDYTNNLSKSAHEVITDICTIGKNLGFNVSDSSYDKEWSSGKEHEFYFGSEIFCKVKAFLNGNIHIKLSKEFMKKFNIEASRLNGWIKSPEEAVNEFEDLTIEEAQKYFNSNLQITNKSLPLLINY
jgi:hypothetical protein